MWVCVCVRVRVLESKRREGENNNNNRRKPLDTAQSPWNAIKVIFSSAPFGRSISLHPTHLAYMRSAQELPCYINKQKN